jgi:hypothetical protein
MIESASFGKGEGYKADKNESAWDETENLLEFNDRNTESEAPEKSEAQLEYEKREDELENEIFDTIDKQYDQIFPAVKSIITEIGPLYLKRDKEELEEKFKDLSSEIKQDSSHVVKTLLDLIKATYPSQYDEPSEKPESELAYDYKRDSITRSENAAKNLKQISPILRRNRNQKIVNIATQLDNIAEAASDYGFDSSRAILEYLANERPTMSDRDDVKYQAEVYLQNIGAPLFTIATKFSDGLEKNQKVFIDVLTISQSVGHGNSEYVEEVMNYIDFKRENALEKSTE